MHGACAALQRCESEGRLVACDVVWAEVTGLAPSRAQLESDLLSLHVGFDPLNASAAMLAGEAWRIYRKRGGSRTRVVADFIVGAHAVQQADRLLTRDRGFYRGYFKKLKIIDPSKR